MMLEPVGYLEAEDLRVEANGGIEVGGVQDDVAESSGNRLLRMQLTRTPLLNLRRDLQRAALEVEEPEPVAAPGCLQRAWLRDQPAPQRGDRLGVAVHVVRGLHREGDEVESPLRRGPESECVLLGDPSAAKNTALRSSTVAISPHTSW